MTNPLLTLENIRTGAVPSDAVAVGFLLGEIQLLRDQRDTNLAKEVERIGQLQAEIERLREVLTIPNITPDTTSSALFIRTLSEHEKCQPVNTQDLINALMWRVKNQRREIARLQEKRAAHEPCEQLSQDRQLERIQQERLTWAMACECTCVACETFSNVIRLACQPSEGAPRGAGSGPSACGTCNGLRYIQVRPSTDEDSGTEDCHECTDT